MSAVVLALIAAISISVWSYSKLQSHTGYGNSKNALTGAAVIFVLAFVVIFGLAHMLTAN